MASKNVETLRAAHESWNKRDFAGVVKNAAEGLVYTDNARAVTLNSRDRFREWTEGWAKAFSDGRISKPRIHRRRRCRCRQIHCCRHKRRTIRFNEVDRAQNVFAVLRDLPL